MTEPATTACLVCKQTSSQAPLIAFRFKESSHWICSQHLPILIHHPERLADILPGAENLAASEHHD